MFDGSSLAGLELLFPLRYVPALYRLCALSEAAAAQYQQDKRGGHFSNSSAEWGKNTETLFGDKTPSRAYVLILNTVEK